MPVTLKESSGDSKLGQWCCTLDARSGVAFLTHQATPLHRLCPGLEPRNFKVSSNPDNQGIDPCTILRKVNNLTNNKKPWYFGRIIGCLISMPILTSEFYHWPWLSHHPKLEKSLPILNPLTKACLLSKLQSFSENAATVISLQLLFCNFQYTGV